MHLGRHPSAIAALIWLAGATYTVSSGASHPACQPSAEIEAVVARFGIVAAERARADGTWDAFESGLLAALERFPYDVHLHRHYQDVHRPDLASLVERYRALAAERPQDPAAQYLYGRVLGLLDREDAEAPLLEALRVDPHYPWAHFALIRMYEVTRPDPNQAQAHLVAFIEQCPTSPAVLGRLRNITDPGLARKVAASVRSGFEATKDPSLVAQLQAVWTTEFKVFPPDEHAAVRERVRRDLALLRDPQVRQDERTLEALLEGYALVGDDEGLTWTIESMARSFPANGSARAAAVQLFDRQHRVPEEGDSSPAGQTYYRELSDAARRWTELWPDDPEVWLSRFRALSGVQDASAEELLSTIDTLLDKVARRPDFRTQPPVGFQIARVLVQKGVSLDRVPALVEHGLQRLAAERPRIVVPGADSALVVSELERTLAFEGWSGRETLFDAYLKQGRLDEARATLAEMERVLSHHGEAGEPDAHGFHHLRASWSARRAALARAEGATLDALLYYHTALMIDPLAQDAPRDAAADLWRELGAGTQALGVWSSTVAGLAVPFGETKELELPEFAFQDLTGRTWRLSELQGKVVLINVWATWCPPCLVELPWLQELHDRIRDRPDLAVLTLSVDENPGVVEPFMRHGGYNFPVVFAYEYIRDLWGHQWTIPCTWIVDPRGTVRREQFGSGSGERWVDAALQAMQQVARGTKDTP